MRERFAGWVAVCPLQAQVGFLTAEPSLQSESSSKERKSLAAEVKAMAIQEHR